MFKKFTKAALALSLACSFNFNAMAATDVVIILDTSGSTGGLLPNWRTRMHDEIMVPFLIEDPDTRFGLASHVDFPFFPYGGAGEYGYRMETPLTTDVALVLNVLNALSSANGGDSKESQYEALFQAMKGTGLDLNNNGSYADLGDISPTNMGWGQTTPNKILIHFTNPLDYHNDPAEEPNYPYAGVVNHPSDFLDLLYTAATMPAVYTLTNATLPGLMAIKEKSATKTSDMLQGHVPSERMLPETFTSKKAISVPGAIALTSAEKIALISGGKVLSVDDDLSSLKDAIDTIIEKEAEKRGECPVGKVKVQLPFGFICVEV
jgi:hypothetical protein